MSHIRGLRHGNAPIWRRAVRDELRQRPWERSPWAEQLRRAEPLRDIVILDAHAHIGEFPGFFVNQADAAGMLDVMDRIGMRAAIISSNAGLRSDPEFGNQMVLQTLRAHPDRFLGYVIANPHYVDDMEAALDRYLDEPGMVAIKLHPMIHDSYPILGPRYDPVWEVAGRRRVPVLFHTGEGENLEDVAELARRHPYVPLLVGHAAQDISLEGMAELANTYPNVYVDMTVPESYNMTEFFAAALNDVRQLIFGTDFPWGNCHFRVGAVIYARLPDETKRRVLGQNMADLLGIDLG